jgi:Family of unknown function (DUF6428)
LIIEIKGYSAMECCSSQIEGKPSLPDAAATAASHLEKPVTLVYGDRHIRAGFHITEAKTCTIKSLDCGSNRHAWNETIIQLLDLDGPESGRMAADKFIHILGKAEVRLDEIQAGQIIFEIGRPDEAMQLFDFVGIQIGVDGVAIKTHPRLAVCKPAAVQPSSANSEGYCATPGNAGGSCCP